jgi:HSP20 family protein
MHDELMNDAREGELPVDVAETQTELIILAPVAGADPAHISISFNGDILTIRGTREAEIMLAREQYFMEECFWGAFSRSIILPCEVRVDDAQATFRNGLLTIRIPKQAQVHRIPIVVIDEE